MSGNNLTSITNVTGFELGYNPTNNNQSIDDVGILWNFDSTSTALYDEDTILTSESVGGVCNSADIISDLAKCYSGFTSTSDSSILALTLTVTPAQINSDNSENETFNVGSDKSISPTSVHPLLFVNAIKLIADKELPANVKRAVIPG